MDSVNTHIRATIRSHANSLAQSFADTLDEMVKDGIESLTGAMDPHIHKDSSHEQSTHTHTHYPFFYDPHVIENLDPTIEGLQLGEFRLVPEHNAIYKSTKCNDVVLKTKYNSQQIHYGLGNTDEPAITIDKEFLHCKTPYGLKVELDTDSSHVISTHVSKKKKTLAFSNK